MTTEVLVEKTFSYEGEKYKKGDVVEFPDSVANSVIEKGYADEYEGEEDEDEDISIEVDEEPEVEVTEGSDPWDKLSQRREESASLPEKWNPSQKNPSEPEPNPLRGIVTRKGKGPNDPFIVVKEKETEDKYTVWQHTALRALINSVDTRDLVEIKFEGEDTNPHGQTYLNYTAAALKPNGKERILEEPEED